MSLSKNLLKHTSIYSAANLLERLVSFILLPFYAHIFETEGYGVIGLVDAAVGILAIALSTGLHQGIVREYYEQPANDRGIVTSTAIRLAWGMACVVMPLPILFSPWISHVMLGDARYYPVIVLALITLTVDIGGKCAASYLIIQQRSLLLASLGLVRLLVAVSLNIVLVLVLQVGIIGIFIASLVATSVAAAIVLFVAIRENGFAFDRRIAGLLWRFQRPLIPAEIVAFAARQIERVLLRFTTGGLNAVGVLEMAYKFPPLLNILLVTPFTLSWQTKSMELAEDAGAPVVMGEVFTTFYFVLLFGALLLAVDVGPLLMVLTPRGFWQGARIAQIEVVTTVLGGLVGFMSFGLIYRKRTGKLAVIRATMSIAKVAASIYMIATFGLAGAAFSALLRESATLLWVTRESQRMYRVEFPRFRIAALTAGAVALFAVVELTQSAGFGPALLVASGALPTMVDWVALTPLAWLRGGHLVDLLKVRQEALAMLIMNTLLATGYLTMIGVARPGLPGRATLAVRRRVSALAAARRSGAA